MNYLLDKKIQNQHLKKFKKKSSVEMMPGETEMQWAKRLRDKQEEENRKFKEL